jgi:glutathione S-transferase
LCKLTPLNSFIDQQYPHHCLALRAFSILTQTMLSLEFSVLAVTSFFTCDIINRF